MNFNDYQTLARKTRAENPGFRIIYPALGLGGESGEVLELIKKSIRPGGVLNHVDLALEMGDVLWYLSALADDIGVTLSVVAEMNIGKLAKRHNVAVAQADGAGE